MDISCILGEHFPSQAFYMPNSFLRGFVYSSHFFHPWKFVGVAIIVIATMLQASNKSQRQYSSYNWVSVPSAWPTAASVSAVSLKFLSIIKGKDELICTDLKQDQNTGFPNPSFFYQGWWGAFYPCGRERKRELFHASPVPLFLWRFFPTLYFPPLQSIV